MSFDPAAARLAPDAGRRHARRHRHSLGQSDRRHWRYGLLTTAEHANPQAPCTAAS